MNNYEKHALKEFEILGLPGDDDMQRLICDQVIELLNTFGGHGHSGSSAPYALGLFSDLAKFNPISPLTGEVTEWIKVSDDLWQNNRSSDVFKDEAGKAYWIEGKIFRDPNGSCYTNKDSRVPVEFPWTKPKSEYVDVPE